MAARAARPSLRPTSSSSTALRALLLQAAPAPALALQGDGTASSSSSSSSLPALAAAAALASAAALATSPSSPWPSGSPPTARCCGIAGVVGGSNLDAREYLLEALTVLRNRGYDSAGMATCSPAGGGGMVV